MILLATTVQKEDSCWEQRVRCGMRYVDFESNETEDENTRVNEILWMLALRLYE